MKAIVRPAAPVAALALLLAVIACGGGGGSGNGGGGDNLLENPSAEEGIEGFVGHNNVSIRQDTTTASDGAASVNVSIQDVQGAGIQFWKADGVTMTPVSAGQEYTFSLDVKGDVGKSMRLEILWHSSAGAFLETSLGPVFFVSVGSFSRAEFSAKAPDGAGLAVPQLVTDAAPGQAMTVWVDNVRFAGGASASSSPGPTASPPAAASPTP
jgi:hypothetical protein